MAMLVLNLSIDRVIVYHIIEIRFGEVGKNEDDVIITTFLSKCGLLFSTKCSTFFTK